MLRIGKLAATHGLQGALILTHVVGASGWLKKDDVLFLELNKGSYIPFFVTSARATGDDEYLVTFEDIGRVEEARKLVGKQAYVREELLAGHAQDSPLLWIGFNLVDKQKGALGSVQDVVQTGHQWLGVIKYEGREVLIPLIEPMILDINLRNKFIRMDLPEGLLDI